MTTMPAGVATVSSGTDHILRAARAAERFARDYGPALVRACQAIGERYRAGGRLLAFGAGAQASDAHHVAVEFAHPVIVGKKSLAAMALTEPAAAAHLAALGRAADIALVLAVDPAAGEVPAVLAAARRAGMLTLLLSGSPAPEPMIADFTFDVPGEDPMVVQEVHETAYHVIWELVHVFLEHRGP